MNLKDRVVVITGAGSGIGRATALAFAREGARIAASDIHQERLDALKAELGDRALLVEKVDVASRADMRTFADRAHAAAPAADVIVNNAGVACNGTFLEMSLDDWDWLLGINLKGVVHGCHYFLPKMVERGTGGHVVNIASIFGIFAPPGVTSYVASKFAVRGFSLSLREELAEHKIGVTAICPGMINTAIVADARTKASMAGRRSKIVDTFHKKGLSPDKVAAAILDSVQTNPAVRTVGTDARIVAALTRLAPRAVAKVGGIVQRRLSAS
jgi:NADP-dependent 3-hydroxy acid dehydrogenase YdfG